MRHCDPQDFCPTVTIPAVREMQRQGKSLLEIGIRLNITKQAIDAALWRYIDVPDEDLSPLSIPRHEPMF